MIKSIAGGLLALCTLAFLPAEGQEVLEDAIITTTDWPPYVDGTSEGIATAVVTQALRGMRREPRVVYLPNFQAAFDAGPSVFGVYPLLASPERERDYLFSDPIMDFEYIVVVHADNLAAFSDITELRDLRQFSTRRVKGYSYGPLDPFLREDPAPLPSQVVALQLLLDEDERIDYVAISRLHFQWLLDTEFFNDQHNFAILDRPNQDQLRWSIDLHLLIHKDRENAAEELRQFNDSLAQIRATRLPERLKRRARDDTRDRHFVMLTDPAAFSLVTARLPESASASCDTARNGGSVTVPRGTRAIVLDWSDNFEGQHSLSVNSQLQALSKVRVLNGPLKDEVVCVQSMFIELSTPE